MSGSPSFAQEFRVRSESGVVTSTSTPAQIFFPLFLIFLIFSAGPSSMANNHSNAVTKERALEIARKAIADLKPGADLVVLEDKTIEKDFGWVFFYTTKKYLKTRNPSDLLPGAGPLVVHRDGSTQFLSTSLPPNKAIEEYEIAWHKNKQHP